MDPDTTLDDLIDAATRQNTSRQVASSLANQVRELADELATWIEKGGYAPADPRAQEER